MTEKFCPNCEVLLEFIGSVGITVHEGVGDSNIDDQADRYDCEGGHTMFVIDALEGADDG